MSAKKKKIYIFTAILLAITLFAGIVGIYAKYRQDIRLRAELLDQTGGNNEYLEVDIGNGYPIYMIYNSSVSFAVDETYTVNADKSEALSKSDNTYVVKGKVGDKVTVKATMTAFGLTKTIGAVFAFVDSTSATTYSVTDEAGEYFIVLDIYVGTTPPADITIRYAAGLIPDNTNPLMQDWLTGTGVTEKTLTGLQADAHYALIFFDETDGDHTQAITALPNDNSINLGE